MTTDNLSPELQLLPCPFCGYSAGIRGEDGHGFYVACDSIDCFCCVGECYDRDAMPDHFFASEEEAIAAWNKRAQLETRELPESLRDPMRVLERGRVLNLGVRGVSRIGDNARAILIHCAIEPSDDDLRALHNQLSLLPGAPVPPTPVLTSTGHEDAQHQIAFDFVVNEADLRSEAIEKLRRYLDETGESHGG